jgi:hypothetical protein
VTSGLRGDLSSLGNFSKSLKTMPFWLGREAARFAAPAITQAAHETFDRGRDPYGVTWQESRKGESVDLNETGALRNFVEYKSIGTLLRIALGVSYAKYQIGKRKVFPTQGSPLPVSYRAALDNAVQSAVAQELGQ